LQDAKSAGPTGTDRVHQRPAAAAATAERSDRPRAGCAKGRPPATGAFSPDAPGRPGGNDDPATPLPPEDADDLSIRRDADDLSIRRDADDLSIRRDANDLSIRCGADNPSVRSGADDHPVRSGVDDTSTRYGPDTGPGEGGHRRDRRGPRRDG
jgi:hypothetical protein